MPLGEKIGRPFELLNLIGRKRKEEAAEHHHRLSGSEARAYANATGSATSGYTHSASHSSHHSNASSSFYPGVKYERITPSTQSAPVVTYERLTPGSIPSGQSVIKYEHLTPGSAAASAQSTATASAVTHPSPLDYEAAAREAAFPSPDLVPSAAVASSSFRSAPSPALSSLPSPGMLTPLTPAVGVTPTPVGRSPSVESIRLPPAPRQPHNLASPAQPPVGPAGAHSAPFSSVMEEWMTQLRTPTPDVALLPSPYDFNKDRPTPMDTNSMDMRRLQDALLPTPPPDVHDQRQHPKNSAYVTTRGPRPLLEDIASLCRDLNSQDPSNANKGMLSSSSGQMETKYTSFPARPLRAREGSISSAFSDDGESQAKVLAAAAALSSVSSMGLGSTPTTKGKRRKMCTAEGCQNLSRSRGLCKAHGGGRRCSVDGCSRASQSGSLCITHGGGKRCTVDGCVKAAQSRGMCKAHGGGVRCRVEGCAKSSQGDGFCRSHGGGRRCGHPSGCNKWAQRNGMCMAHSEGKYGNSYRGRQHRLEKQDDVAQQT